MTTTANISQSLLPLDSDEDRLPGAGSPQPFKWGVCSGADSWTNDPVKISNMSDPPIIEGLLRVKEVATVVGAAKTAKTWFALYLALMVAAGERFLEMVTHRRKVLYLDYELKKGTFEKRMSLLEPERPEGFFYQCLRGESRLPTVAEITELVVAEGCGLLVVDSLYRTGWLTEENNNDSTSRELTALQTFTANTSCSLLCVDHTAKGGGSERSAVDAARGASAKGGFYDALLVLRPTDKGPDPQGTYAILDAVLRDWPKAENLPLISFWWNATQCHVELAGNVERNEAETNRTRILEAISDADKGISIHTIAIVCSIGESTVRRALGAPPMNTQVVAFPDPTHRQRVLYRLKDFAGAPLQTAPNSST
ncbi:MAG: AAA family ATPase [Verrucomicrobiota bacterium]